MLYAMANKRKPLDSRRLRGGGLGLRQSLQLLLWLRLRQRQRSRQRHWCIHQLRQLCVDRPTILVEIGFFAVRVLSRGLDGFPFLFAQYDKIEAMREDGINSVAVVMSKRPAANKG